MQQKLKLLKVLDILRETDKSHPITAVGICKELEKSGISAERKSVCRDIKTLCEYGYKIILCHDNKLGYYMEKGKEAPPKNPKPVTLDLLHITVEYKKEDADEVRTFLSKGKETEDGDYITAELGIPSSELFPALFTLGTKVKLLEPVELKEEFEKKLDDIAEFYRRRRSSKKMDFWLL